MNCSHWQSKFTAIDSGKRLALDCMFLVEFDNDGSCSLFREWWHIRTLNVDPNEQSA